MKQFNDFSKFTKHIEKVATLYDIKETKVLQYLGLFLEEAMKETIGHLQRGAGTYESWAPLKPATIADKARKGYIFNDEANPLYRTGKLQDSIKHTVLPHHLVIGSDDEVMIYQEFGVPSHNLPPRSVMGLTMFKSKEFMVLVLGKFIQYWIMDQKFTLLDSKPIRK